MRQIYGGLPATTYGLFLGYLNVPAHVYATARVVMMLPWSFKFAFGLLNDTRPIGGYRRKPYMALGWALCALMLLRLALTTLPPPYYCLDEVTRRPLTDEPPCNPSAADAGGHYALMMMLAALGYVVADVAADGLTVEIARREPERRRGRTQTAAYMTRSLGVVLSMLLVGFGMNGAEYNGSFEAGLSFNAICGLLALPAAAMAPVSWLMIDEPACTAHVDARAYLRLTWELLCSKAMFYVVCFQFLSAGVLSISTPATGEVKQHWAGVKNLPAQLFGVAGYGLFIAGLSLVRSRLLGVDWRLILLVSQASLQLIDMPFAFCTIFDVVRNQYFYLGETFLIEIPDGANFIVSTYVIVEMAENGNEGLVYGLLTTTYNLGAPLGRAVGNQLYALFSPPLDDAQNYIDDTPAFRNTVAASYALSYGFAFLSLVSLLLLPSQKAEAQRRKKHWPRHPRYAAAIITMVGLALTYALLVNFLSMFEATACLRFAGGQGCESDAAADPEGGSSQ